MTDRIELLKKELPSGVDCAIVTSGFGRYYFTGMRSSAGTLLVTRGGSYFIIDFRYIEKAKRTIKNAQVMLQDKLYEQIKDIFAKEGVKTAAVETTYMTMGEFFKMKEKLDGFELLTDSGVDTLIIKLRAHKDAAELAGIRAAQAITDRGFTHMLGFVEAGRTEREVALELQSFMLREGAEKLAFDTIAVSGVNSSLPHGVPSEKKIEKGDFLTLDFGAMVDGYCADMTRTVAIGSATDEMEQVYATVLKAHKDSMAAVKPGIQNVDIDKVARDIIYAAGYEGCFGHGLGHSLGLEIHEEPRYSPAGSGVVEVGHVMTIEPGIYLEGKFGVRIEDTIYIGENGVIDLASSPKDLIIL